MKMFPALARPRIPRRAVRLVFVFAGMAMTTAALIGTRTYVAPAEARKTGLEEKITEAAAAVEVLRGAHAQYLAFSQRNMVVQTLERNVRDDDGRRTIETLHKLSFRSRSAAVRDAIEQIALAEGSAAALRSEGAYSGLVEACLANFTPDTRSAVFEKDRAVMGRVVELSGSLSTQRFALMRAKIDADLDLDSRKLVLLVLRSIGSTLLVLAFLF